MKPCEAWRRYMFTNTRTILYCQRTRIRPLRVFALLLSITGLIMVQVSKVHSSTIVWAYLRRRHENAPLKITRVTAHIKRSPARTLQTNSSTIIEATPNPFQRTFFTQCSRNFCDAASSLSSRALRSSSAPLGMRATGGA